MLCPSPSKSFSTKTSYLLVLVLVALPLDDNAQAAGHVADALRNGTARTGVSAGTPCNPALTAGRRNHTPCPARTWLQTALFSLMSTRTSLVPICLVANFLISFTARGALFLKEMS